MRPSILFGPEDGFFNKFADMARYSPFMPLIGGGKTRFQPVYVCDVAEAIARSVDGSIAKGTTYELGGPEIFTFRELMEEILAVTERKRMLVSVPWMVARLQAAVLGLLPRPLLTSDQLKLLRHDNVVSEKAIADGRTLEGIGIRGETLDAILPSYLWRYRPYGQFAERRTA
jgi:NADH dehydrogenase